MNCFGIFDNNNVETRRTSKTGKRGEAARRASSMALSCMLGFTMLLSPVTVRAEGGQPRSMNNSVNYTLAGETDGVLDYARTDFTKEDASGIHLTVTKWAKLPGSWGGTDKGPYNGRFLINFFDDDFYKHIQSIEVNGVQFEKEADGALWKVPINNATLQSGLIGVITNTDVTIKLKNGATLTSLGLDSKKIDFTTNWVRSDGKADKGGNDNGFILKNNPNVPVLPSNKSSGNENYLGSGVNGLGTDGTQSKDGNFTGGATGKSVSYDAKNKVIRSTVSFKPDQNFLQANSAWVLYINEVIPKELLRYIDTNEVRLGVSTPTGKITASNPIKLNVYPNGNGLISTKDTPSLSIVGGDWSKVTQVRNTLDSQVFYGVLGQRRSYTIEYKLKSNVTNQEFAKALNDYIAANNQQLNFESWLTADFVDSSSAFPNIRKPDGGKPNKRLQNSYSNAFLEVLDTDKDGLFDFVEDEIGSDKYNVDTDGDGVPDGQEYLTDKTDPTKAKSYLVVKPNVTTTNIEANKAEIIEGTVPKTIYNNPADETKKLAATNTDAGNVIVKAYKYIADDTDYTQETAKAQTTIPFSGLTDGKFKVNVPAGTFADGDKVILVAYSPDGKNPMVSSTKVNVGAIKVTFDTNGGKWADGTNTDKVVSAVNGKATQPEEPTRDGYKFMGWAATAGATEADADILKNITEAKEVFAVWKDNKAPVIDNIGDQTVIEGQPITEITVTTDDPTATVTVKDLPTGVQYSNGKISGTPKVTDWHGNEETREITVTVEAKDSAGNTSTKTFKITVQRDTDKDGIPDVTDLDDDGDGYLDSEETAKGSDPKNSKSVPAGMITPIAQTTVTNPIQTVNDKTAITNIVVTPGASGATVTVDNSKLPSGVTYDAGTKTISGTPNVTNWGSTEEKRKFEIPVVVKNPDGSKITKTVEITVLRDTDGDGDPDITDTDDDGDGYSDTEETTKGSDPKNSHSIPAGTITPADPLNIINPVQTVVDRHAINDITIGTIDIDSTEHVDSTKLPPGVTYNPGTLSITGTPNVTNWGSNEEKRKYEIPIVVTNSDGLSITRIVEITVLRDTDGDGDPDITDPDDDGDGYTDLAEKTQGSDPKSASSIPAAVVTPVAPTTITNGTQTVNDKTAITDIVVTPGNAASVVTVDNSKLPNGVTYDPGTKTISGTPNVTDWGSTEEKRKFEIPVVVTNPDGTKITKTVEITVLRDTDGDGDPDITDTDDDGDGVPDTVETAKGSDPKNANSRPAAVITPVAPTTITNGTQSVNDKTAITNIVVTPGNNNATVSVDNSKLPNGVTYDAGTKTISGTPNVTDWGSTEEKRKFEIPVVVTNPDGSKVTKTVEITVLRDTDGDGDPDITDPDDDGDGVSDVEENARGSNPKNRGSVPAAVIVPVSPTTITNGTQSVNDKTAISNITITPGATGSTVAVDTSKLPNGVTYDAGTKTISGTPNVTDWGSTEEKRKFEIPVVVTNPDGTKITKTVEITVLRDTDGDGDPDITDTDDDGDGVPDTVETAKGSDPKNANSRPAAVVTPVAPTTITNGTQSVNDKTAISNIVVTPGNNNSTVSVDNSKLPNGVTYDSGTKTISGTPNVTDWGSTEEKRKFEIPVVITNPDGSKITKTVEITVLRDTDGDGDPDITDTDDDGDGVPDTVETAKGSDPKNANSRPAAVITPVAPTTITNGTQSVNDKTAISNIVVTPGNNNSTVSVDNSKLPNGVTYDSGTKTISGTPNVTDWGSTEEKRKFEIPVVVTNPDGSKITKTVEITVLRDTDGDGDPDITDTDDDGDGVPDTVETAKGSDPKNANSRPAATITPIAQPTITNGTQSVNDKTAITNIVVTPGNNNATVTVDSSKLPNGVTYDSGTKTISGTPNVTDWGSTEEKRKFEIPVVITNPDGSKITKTVEITVLRDTDGDGDPDITDTDDDGDGYSDAVEASNGTNPKDANSRPTSSANSGRSGGHSARNHAGKTPLRSVLGPKTGDGFEVYVYAGFAIFAAFEVAILMLIRRRRRDR